MAQDKIKRRKSNEHVKSKMGKGSLFSAFGPGLLIFFFKIRKGVDSLKIEAFYLRSFIALILARRLNFQFSCLGSILDAKTISV